MNPSAHRPKPKIIVLAVLAALACLLATASPAAAGGHHRRLEVLTFNIHHGAGTDGVLDLERVARVIEDSGADVIAMQEVDKHFGARSEWVDQPAWFAERLRMHVTFAANLDLPPVNAGEPNRQYGTAILSKYPIKHSQNTLLPMYPGQEQRGLLEATIKVHGNTVVVADTHLTHNNNAERQEQADKVVEVLGERRHPTVLTGDLNATPDAPEIQTLTAVWDDAWTEVGEGPGYTYDTANPTKRIDYVLHSHTVRAKAAEVITTDASDHLPVLAVLDVPRS
jgi:endonuclease/exonuclease/phosphatase family metal-dependent hydrolase